MSSSNNLADIYEQLMDISRNMLESKHYGVAFHALEAALHCADDLHDEQLLFAVQKEAQRQRDIIDTTDPEHRMSTKSATQRGGQSLYGLLLRQISMNINQIEREHRQEKIGLLKFEDI